MTDQNSISISITSFTEKHADEGPTQASRRPQLNLVAMPSGVAASRTRRVQGNAHAQSWTLFVTREQLEVFMTADTLRFDDPIRFDQFRKEFAHVFDLNTSIDHPRAIENRELPDPSLGCDRTDPQSDRTAGAPR